MKSQNSCSCFSWIRRRNKVETNRIVNSYREDEICTERLPKIRVTTSVSLQSLKDVSYPHIPHVKTSIYTRSQLKVQPLTTRNDISFDDMVNLESPLEEPPMKSVFSGLIFKERTGKLPCLLPTTHLKRKYKQ